MARQRAKIYLAPHFHFDPVWIEDQRTYTRRAFELVEQYLEACRQDGSYHFLLSELDCLQPFMAAHSDHRAFVRELAAAGRIGAGGSYSEPNEMSIQGEAIVRNLIYGRLYHEELLGTKPKVYLPLDVFGHCIQLPQLAAKAGFEAIVWSKSIAGAPPLCFALAPDGSTLLQKREPYWYYPKSYEQFLDTVADGLEHQAVLGLNQDLRLLGGDMAPPAAWLAGRSERLRGRDPVIEIGTPEKYLAAVSPEAHLRSAVIPATGRDLSWYHMGTAVTRAELKIANRLAENRVLNAEKWATLAGLLGASYPDLALDKAWRQLLFGQHHDAITGTSSDIPFLDLLSGYREALELAAAVEDKALAYIAASANTAGSRRAPRDGAALVVFNSLNWTRTDVCRARVSLDGPLARGFRLTAENGREVPCQVADRSGEGDEAWAEIAFVAADVPAIGYRTYYLAPAQQMPESPTFSEASDATIENEFFAVRAEARAGGGITSIRDKRSDKEIVNADVGPANEVVALGERADREMAPWELFTTGEMVRSGQQDASVEVLQGPVFNRLRVSAEMPGRCGLLQEITLWRGLPRIDLRTSILEYRGQHELFALSFPLAVQGGVPTFEDRFAAVVRRPSLGRLDFRTLEDQNLSRSGLGSAQNWIEVGPAASLSVMSGREKVRSLPLGPCTIVTSVDLKERNAIRALMNALLSRGITCSHVLDEDDPEADGDGCALRISLGRRNSYSRKLLELVPQAATRLSEATGNGGWGGVLLRRADPKEELPDTPVLIAGTEDPGGVVLLAERLAADIRQGGLQIPNSCDFSKLPEQADDYGVALINRGSLAASLENDGTLAALLFHTSAWSTHAWGEGRLERFFIPEHRSHVFEHSLYPHAGNWRQAQVVRAGYEVNNPLRASQAAVESGALPATFGLLGLDSPNLVVTAVKPLGNPIADHRANERSHPEKGFLLRLYEAHGDATSARIGFASAPEEAWLTDLMERKTRDVEITGSGWRRPPEIELEVPACGIVSLAVRLAALAEAGAPENLDPTGNCEHPLFCRYWDHNAGAAPRGNQPVTLWMRGQVPIGQTTRFSLGISNDARDREISGTINVVTAQEWTMIPRQVPYRIPAAGQAVYEIMVVVPPDTKPCFIRATTEHDEQVVQDVLPIGEIVPLESSLTQEGKRFLVRVKNPNSDYVEGEVALVTPLESWGRAADTLARGLVGPRVQAFRLEPQEMQELAFAIAGDRAGIWAVAKVMWYGQVQYVQEAQPG